MPLSAWLNSWATDWGTFTFFANDGECAAAAINFACFFDLLGMLIIPVAGRGEFPRPRGITAQAESEASEVPVPWAR